jgi:hypothetical protein
MLSLMVLISLAGQTPKAEEPKKAEKPIPDDFKIVATSYGEFTAWKPWLTTITAEGKVSQKTSVGLKSTEKESKLSPADLRDLLDQVEKAEFSKLKKDYKYSISDAHHLILEITADKKTHKVEVYAFDRVKEKEDVDRFLKVFREVLKKVPSPNEEETPDTYKR